MAIGEYIPGNSILDNISEKVMKIITGEGSVFRLGHIHPAEKRRLTRNRAKKIFYLAPMYKEEKDIDPGKMIDEMHAAVLNLSVSEAGDGNLLTEVITPICKRTVTMPTTEDKQ